MKQLHKTIKKNQSTLSKKAQLGLLIASALMSQPLLAPVALAATADFTIINGQVEITTQTLGSNNTGTIEAGGQLNTGAYTAINAFGINNTVNNSGSITTAGDYTNGIYSSGANATITNSGSITTTGISANGILLRGTRSTNATITNSGSMTTAGNYASAIYSRATKTTITNSGSMTTTGDYASAILSFGANASITNSGSMTTTGRYSSGILSIGFDTTITNSGSISATGQGSFAILGGKGSSTLNLLPGSSIIGAIDLGSAGMDTDTVNIMGNNVSGTMTFQNTEAVNLLDGSTGVVITNGADKTVTTVDTTGESTRGVALAGLTSGVHSVITQRTGHDAPLEPVNVASLEVSPSMMFTAHKPVAWVQAFGGNFNRDNDGGALAYEHNHAGVSFGYEQDFDQVRVGFMGGYAKTDTDTVVASFKTDADNLFVGAYSAYKLGSVRLTASLVGGYSEYDNDRLVIDNLLGAQVAKSDFNSVFISPSVTIASAFTVSNSVELRPSATLSYSMAWLDGYTEKGTTNSNLSVGSRKAKALTAKAQLEGAYSFNKASEVALRVGVNSRHTDDDNTNVSLAGNRFNFANSGDDNVTGGFAGMSFRAAAPNHFNIIADVEVGGASKEDYVNGYVGLEYVF